MTLPMIHHPILVVSYNDAAREALCSSLERTGANSVPCATFLDAEDVALEGIYNGILVDLQSIIKAKGDEKLIACSLTAFFPTLRVRVLGGMLVPMAMPGDSKQDKSIAEFLAKSCAAFTPRMLRQHKRREVGLSATIRHNLTDAPGFIINLSWGGAFLIDMAAERFHPGDAIILAMADADLEIEATVAWVRPWGSSLPPGSGICFANLGAVQESYLEAVLKHQRHNARDRLVAR